MQASRVRKNTAADICSTPAGAALKSALDDVACIGRLAGLSTRIPPLPTFRGSPLPTFRGTTGDDDDTGKLLQHQTHDGTAAAVAVTPTEFLPLAADSKTVTQDDDWVEHLKSQDANIQALDAKVQAISDISRDLVAVVMSVCHQFATAAALLQEEGKGERRTSRQGMMPLPIQLDPQEDEDEHKP